MSDIVKLARYLRPAKVDYETGRPRNPVHVIDVWQANSRSQSSRAKGWKTFSGSEVKVRHRDKPENTVEPKFAADACMHLELVSAGYNVHASVTTSSVARIY